MKKSAYDAINGLNKNYKTSNEGFKKLTRTYGTHVVVGAALGGRIRQSMTANVANISTQFDMKTFARAAYSGAIAKAVLEYIPNQNYKEKIMAIYPVTNNKVRFNMGFFIGDKTHKPARVSWDGTNVTIIEDADLDFGAVSKLYIRRSSVTAEAPNGTTPFAGRVEDSYLKGKKSTGRYNNGILESHDIDYNYPVVKVFNHIWTREDYTAGTDKYGK